MEGDFKSAEESAFGKVAASLQLVAAWIDELEEMNDFQLVERYEEIHELWSATSFIAFTTGVAELLGDRCELYSPTRDEIRAHMRRYEQLTKGHPTDAYRRFRSIANRMDEKLTAVDAILKDRAERAAAGGRSKAANAKPNPERAKAIAYAKDHHEASAALIKMRLKLKASARSIRGWIKDSRSED